MAETPRILRFGGFMLDLAQRRLSRSGETVELGSRYFDALALLAGNPGQLVSKDRFMDEVWRGIPVTDEALTQGIRTLRRALEDDASAPRFIQTVPKHGYRFVAEVEEVYPTTVATAATSPAARIAGATTLGALSAGLFGGLVYGIFGTSGGIAGLATIVLLTCALAVIGGAGIGAGMALTSLWRGERDWSLLLGGAAGGVVVGALGSALASHGMQSLTGIHPGRVTGMPEGLALGTAVAASTALTFRYPLSYTWSAVSGAGIGALVAGASALAGGRFYGATLSGIEARFPSSHIDMSGLFLISDMAVTAMLEGAVFAACIALANRHALGRRT